MKQKVILILCLLFLTGCASGATASANQTTPAINQGTATILPASSATVVASSGGPGDSNTPTAPTAPTPQPTTPASTGSHQCNSSGCSNPWGYVIGLSGNEQGNYIYSPSINFCGWFACIPNFVNGRGYVVECTDGNFSKSGGIQGACSGHGGEWEAMYQLISGGNAPTPTAQPTKTPTPTSRPSPTPKPTPAPRPTFTPSPIPSTPTPTPSPNPSATP